ncbi:MAG: hypothetical protein ACI81G_001829, partial [Gammaproteobacteria bacterium]
TLVFPYWYTSKQKAITIPMRTMPPFKEEYRYCF